jgi:hypothetical protein
MRKLQLTLLLSSLFALASAYTIVPFKSSWKYLDNGSDQGTAWRATGFADGSWTSGNAELGYGDADEATTVSYGGNANNKYVTTYFRKAFSINETYSSFTLNLIRDDGAVVYVNGVEVYRNNMPAGTIAYTTLATAAVGDDGNTQQTIILPASAFVVGNNVVAIEIHQNSVTSTDISFDLQLLGNRASNQKLVSWNSIWKFLDNGSNQGAGWSASAFNDATWVKGPAELGYGDGDEATTLSYGTDANNKYVTTYFRKTFNNPGAYQSYSLSIKRDDGVAVYVNGTEVFRNNLGTGALYNAFATANAADDGNVPVVVVIPASNFVTGDNTLAVEVHQDALNSSDISFDAELVGNTSSSQSLVEFGERWRYLDNGSDQGTAWRPASFNDGSWPQGWAELGYGDGDENTTVSYGSNSLDKYEATYFRKKINLPAVANFMGYTLNCYRDDGLVVYVNNTEVWRDNMPTGNVTFTTLASTAVSDDGDAMQTVALPASAFAAGENVIAVSVHQSGVTSSDISFDLQLLAKSGYEITRGVYLQMGRPTSVILCYNTDAAVQTHVNYGTALGSLTSTVNEGSAVATHAIQVSGLQANTKYYYEVVEGTNVMQGGAANYFITPPVAGSTQEINIWATGDCGSGYPEQLAARDAYLTYMRNAGKHTDAWLLVGDNAYENGLESEYQSGFFNAYQDSLLRNVLLYPAPGNHDYANTGARQNDHAIPYYDIFTVPTGAEIGGVASGTEAYYSYNYGNIHFISLDSYGKEQNNYRLYDTLGPQAIWLKADLAANTQPWTIVYCHHPPYTMGSHNSDIESELVGMRGKLIPILERYKVDLLICGHSHCYERSYLLKGHYGLETSFNSSTHAISNSSAKYNGTSNSCPYVKNTPNRDNGTVYVVTGSAGKTGSTQLTWPHNAMYYSTASVTGSTAISVKNNRMDGKFIDQNGNVLDQFTIMKQVGLNDTFQINLLESVALTASYEGNYSWSSGGTASSITVSPTSSTTYYVTDNQSCIRDTFFVKVIIPTITTIHPGITSVCAGGTLNLSFTKTGKFFPVNTFTAQLSNATGSFAAPVTVGTLVDTAAGSISVTIPGGTPAGAGYRLRVVANNPAITGTDNGINVAVTVTQTWYLDADNDGHYVSSISACNNPGAGYNTTGGTSGDCNDNDVTKWQSATLYIDADGDGYDAGSAAVCYGATVPQGYSSTTNGTDCNDNNGAVHIATSWYLDADNDGHFISSMSACNNPGAGYNATGGSNGDCNDNDGTKWQSATLYIDADGDGYDAGSVAVCYGATIPQGYSSTTNGTDCNDNNGAVHIATTWYLDADNDGHYVSSISACNNPGTGYNTTGGTSSDCNDNDVTKWQSATLYIDADGDGYDAGSAAVCYGSAVPQGYSLTTSGPDCDDNNGAVHIGATWYLDADNDGHYVSSVYACANPGAGYNTTATLNGDCNDSDNSKWQSAALYTDVDGDGYDAGSATVCYGSAVPQGYSLTTNGTDCDDNNGAVHTGTTWYLDADNDGHYVTSVTACTNPGAGYNTTATVNGDCNDSDNSKWQSVSLYTDADGDGYDAGSSAVCYGSTVPQGYSLTTNGADCDDNNGAVHTGTTWYLDADNDGHYLSSVSGCANPGTGYNTTATSNGDCNDNDNSKWQSGTLYTDADGDGYDAGSAAICYGATIPQGYSATTNGSDCDDNNGAVHTGTLWYLDADNDGHYVSSLSACANPGAGYNTTATNDGDCDDNDNSKWQSLIAYIDADGDGYTVGSATSVCTDDSLPVGYSATSLGADCDDTDNTKWQSMQVFVDHDSDNYDGGSTTLCYGVSLPAGYTASTLGADCVDSNAAINPGATEIPGNGLDDDCNAATSDITGIRGPELESGVKIWSEGNHVYVTLNTTTKVTATVEVYNVLGQLLSSDKFSSGSLYTRQIPGSGSFYAIVKVGDKDMVVTRLVALKND